MGKPSPPPAPDYQGAAVAQGQANIAAGQQTASLSNPNVTNPYGSQTVSYTPTGPNGDMQPNVVQSLNPQSQQTLDSQQRVQTALANLGEQGVGQAQTILGQPFNPNLPDLQTSLPSVGQARTDSGFNGQANGTVDTSGVAKMPVSAGTTGMAAILSRLQPQMDQRDKALRQSLANQGLTAGGEAYTNAMRDNNNANNDLYSQAALQGIGLDTQANQQGYNQALSSAQFGNQATAQNYGQAMGGAGLYNQGLAQNYGQTAGSAQFGNSAIGQALSQKLGLYNQPLNQITALMSGSQIQNPQFANYQGANIGAAPIANATAQAGQFAQGLYGQQMGSYNAMIGGLADLGGAVAGAPFMSDVRLKSNIVKVADDPRGFGIYDYDIAGRRIRGVMAHEVEKIIPNAVVTTPSGYKAVYYGML